MRGIPHMVIIDRSGKVANVHVGYGEAAIPGLIKELNKHLNQKKG